jgi:DNA-binding response OmpR family regulator
MSATPPPRLPGPQPRVLVVDDEPTIRMLAKLMLERGGFAVEEAGDAAAAVAQVRDTEKPFAVVLLDQTLPDRSGTDVLPDLRALAPQTRIVLTSGRAEEDVPDHGADAYLPKPFAREQLVSVVRSVTALTPT